MLKKNNQFDATDQCVMCGLCLPYCPTYNKTLHEAESPRGRISLIQAYAQGQIPLDSTMEKHLNSCLICRTCEKVCPAEVPYGQLIDDIKQVIYEKNQNGVYKFFNKILQYIIKKPIRLNNILPFIKVIAVFFPRIQKYLKQPTQKIEKLSEIYQSNIANSKNIGLFLGCINQLYYQEIQKKLICLFNNIGYNVYVPPQQNCCGALAQHQGDTISANKMIENNIKVFLNTSNPIQKIIFLDSGCGLFLTEYPEGFSYKVQAALSFLSEQNLQFKPLKQKLLLHKTCSENLLGEYDKIKMLLEKIPQLEIVDIPFPNSCCGAAGTYMLTHLKLADKLQKESIETIINAHVTGVLTNNIGCLIHLQKDLPSHIFIKHPLEIIFDQITY